MCANLYQYHNRSMVLQRLQVERRKWAPGVGVGGLGLVGVVIFRVKGVKGEVKALVAPI